MLKYIFLACFVDLVFSQQPPRINVVEEHMSNGDENDIVTIDLKRREGLEDIRFMTQLRFHLNRTQVYVNGHPVIHSVVNSVRMRISITEVRSGKNLSPRLAPVTVRVLVLEHKKEKKLEAQFEFIKIEQFDVLQVDVKQIIWEGSNRKPVTSIRIQDSEIHRKPHEQDHPIFVRDPGFKPRLPSHGLRGDQAGYEHFHHHRRHGHHRHHRHSHNHPRVICWFRKLNIAGKIAVICAAVFTFFGALVSLIICWKRYMCKTSSTIAVPLDNCVDIGVIVEKDEKKNIDGDEMGVGEFHMEINSCYVDVDDKKNLVNE